MKQERDRKFIALTIPTTELLGILQRHGYLPDDAHGHSAEELFTDDVRLFDATVDCHNMRLQIILEGDSLPERYRWRGCFPHLPLREMTPGLLAGNALRVLLENIVAAESASDRERESLTKILQAGLRQFLTPPAAPATTPVP